MSAASDIRVMSGTGADSYGLTASAGDSCLGIPRRELGNPRRGWRVGMMMVVVLSAVLAGCGQTPAGEESSRAEYVEPAWMAEVRQDADEFDAAYLVCMKEAGWEAVLEPDGGHKPVGITSEEQKELWQDASKTCVLELVDSTDPLTEAEWRVRYSRALDTRDCLEAQGYEISDPPSEDVWVEQGLVVGCPDWIPFDEVIVRGMKGEFAWDASTYYALYQTCTQAGPTSTMGW